MLTKQEVKTIKSHKAYNMNVAREAEANCMIVKSKDLEDFFVIDDWAEGDFPELLSIYGTLKHCLDEISRANRVADREGLFSRAWYIEGL